MRPLEKEVHVLEPGIQWGLFQATYLDRENVTLRPNVCVVDTNGNVLLQTNGLGLRGPDVEPGRRIGVVWGDSVVFGALGSSWPERINDYISGCMFLNGGVEGFEYEAILERAVRFNDEQAVTVNVVLPGWHPVSTNDRFQTDLTAAIKLLPNPLLLTLPTSLNATMVDTDISSAFTRGLQTYGDFDPDQYFGFFGVEPYSVEMQQALFRHVCRRNEQIRTISKQLDVPLVDLFDILDSSKLGRFNEYFFDVPHPRPKAYPLIARAVSAGIEAVLERQG